MNSVLTSNTPVTVCNNQLPYSWNGHSYGVAGTYHDTLTSSSGCDSIATLVLTVNSVLTSNTPVTVCNNQLPYSWNGHSYGVAGTYHDTLTSSSGCDSIATLLLTVNSVVSSSTNTIICSNQLPYSWNTQIINASGTYVANLISSAGCDSIATLHLIVYPSVTSNTSLTICNNQLPYNWNGLNINAAGNYSVTLFSSLGCDSIAKLQLTVNPILSGNAFVSICSNQLPYSWNGQTITTSGNYSAQLTGSNGCDSIANLHLNVNNVIQSQSIISVCANSLPYHWNGLVLNSSGSYSVTLLSAAGCDSIAHLQLLINPVINTNTIISICNTQLPYHWNGQVISNAGNYSATLTGSTGCDSIVNLQLIVNPSVSSNTSIVICSSQLPYHWNGQTINAAGVYNVTLVSAAGCDSISILHLVVLPTSNSTTTITVCSNQLPYHWNGQSYNSAGNYPVTLSSSNGCDSIATLKLIVIAVQNISVNQTICSNQLPYSWNGLSISTAGSYLVTLHSVVSGCDSMVTIHLTVNNVINNTVSTTICNSQLPYIWNGQVINTAGNYASTFNGSNGCDSIVNLQLQVIPAPLAPTVNSPIVYCQNENASQLTAIGTGLLWYTTATGGVGSSIAPTPATNSIGTTYYYVSQTNGTCESPRAIISVTVNPIPGLPQVSAPPVYCQGASSVALVAIGNHLLWYTSPTGGVGTSVTPIPSTSTPGSFTYYVSQSNGTCEGPRVPLTVVVNPKPNLGGDQFVQICKNSSTNLLSLYNTSGTAAVWTTPNHQVVLNPSQVTTPGTYILLAANAFGCYDSAMVTVTLSPQVVADAGPDGDAQYGSPYQLQGSGGSHFAWTPAALLNDAGLANPVAVIYQNTTFYLTSWDDDMNCAGYDSVHIKVHNGPAIFVPTAFSPNDDRVNDIFIPTYILIQRLEYFRVFNRYGQLVFETQNMREGWDGIFKGEKQNPDNYVWEVKAYDINGGMRFLKGNVVLIR